MCQSCKNKEELDEYIKQAQRLKWKTEKRAYRQKKKQEKATREKIVFKNLRCSDGLPCTAYTCIQDWCKFPERKMEAKASLSQENIKEGEQ